MGVYLPKVVPAPVQRASELRTLLYEDLDALGFPPSAIIQIEVGRKCAQEIRLLKKLELARKAGSVSVGQP